MQAGFMERRAGLLGIHEGEGEDGRKQSASVRK